MARKAEPGALFTEDTSAIVTGVKQGLEAYKSGLPTVRVSDLIINDYGGNKSALAQALAGTSDKSSPAYKHQMKNISRWLKFETSGKGKQARDASKSKATQARLKGLRAEKHPPQNASVSMTGWVYYDNGSDARWRDIPARGSLNLSGNELKSFLSNMKNGDTSAAYRDVFSAYGASVLTLGSEDNPTFTIQFS